MLIKGNEINLPSLHDLSAHGWGHLTVRRPASLKCISPLSLIAVMYQSKMCAGMGALLNAPII